MKHTQAFPMHGTGSHGEYVSPNLGMTYQQYLAAEIAKVIIPLHNQTPRVIGEVVAEMTNSIIQQLITINE